MNRLQIRRVASVAALVLTSGCGSVAAYGDSNFAFPGTLPAQTFGDRVQSELGKTLEVVQFQPAPGATQTTHPVNSMLRATASGGFPSGKNGPVDAIIFALGTNDPTDFVFGNSTGHNEQGAVDQAEFLMQRAAQSGAKCVVWVLPGEVNPYLIDPAQQQRAKDYLHVFNGYLLSLPRVRIIDGRSMQFRIFDWGSIAAANEYLSGDHLHPNENGAIYLGASLRNIVQECIRPSPA